MTDDRFFYPWQSIYCDLVYYKGRRKKNRYFFTPSLNTVLLKADFQQSGQLKNWSLQTENSKQHQMIYKGDI